jgi:hypothetical protein
MLKHRDTDDMNNAVEYFRGQRYDFIALVDSHSKGGEAWTGTNSAGFSIMNTASYNIKDDDVPDSLMDKEGIVMFKALGICSSTADFETFLDSLPEPWGVEANFGIIDAKGGAAYYEVNNHSWIKYDVNDPTVAPNGFRTVTNFCESGRKSEIKGYERYMTANGIMRSFSEKSSGGLMKICHTDIFDAISRSYSNAILGVDYARDYDSMISSGFFNGITVDQDFIPRRITSASIVIEGVKKGENPLHTVMWTVLGYPACSVAVPLLTGFSDHIPYYIKKTGFSSHSMLCDKALEIKKRYVFPYHVSNGNRYIDLKPVIKGEDGRESLLNCCEATESSINDYFNKIYSEWVDGKISDRMFFKSYDSLTSRFYDIYLNNFASYLQ